MFFCRFALIFTFFLKILFLSRLRTDLRQIWQNVSSCMRFILRRAILKSSKTRSRRPKTLKNRSNFRTGRHVFARCGETVKAFWKIFSAMTSRQLYLSENVIVTVQNRPVFSNTWLNGASKKTLTAIISKTVSVTVKVSMECYYETPLVPIRGIDRI